MLHTHTVEFGFKRYIRGLLMHLMRVNTKGGSVLGISHTADTHTRHVTEFERVSVYDKA